MNKTLTLEQRISIVRYRIENAENTLAEVETHRATQPWSPNLLEKRKPQVLDQRLCLN